MTTETAEAPKPPRLIGRREAARILDCSETTVRRLEADGKLAARRAARLGSLRPPRVRYVLSEVMALKGQVEGRAERGGPGTRNVRWSREEGEVSARVFRLLLARKTLVEIVTELEVPPAAVRAIRDEFMRSFERDDAERKEERRRRDDRAEQRDHDRRAARQEREDRERAEARRARRRAGEGGEREAPAVPVAAGARPAEDPAATGATRTAA